MSAVGEEARVRETEVVEKARRRGFTAEYKLGVLAEADRCTKPGEVGALLRREGLYSSLLSAWRRQRDAGELSARSPKKRGPPAQVPDASSRRVPSGSTTPHGWPTHRRLHSNLTNSLSYSR
jgi:transposase